MSHDPDQMPDTLPKDNRRALRLVTRACRKAALATTLAGVGTPYVSLVTVAFDLDMAPLLLLSGLADHTRNLLEDSRCSLLLDGTDDHPNPQTGPRVTLCGRAERLAPEADAALRTRFLARHPGAALYAGFGDFALWRVVPERAHFVGGFGRAVWFDAPFGQAHALVDGLRTAEPELLDRLNRELAPRLGGWRFTTLDPDGADLDKDGNFHRLDIRAPIEQAGQLPAALAESLDRAF